MHFSAFSDGGRRAEILEIPGHPFYMGTQFHPEYVSRPEAPEPIFVAFLRGGYSRQQERQEDQGPGLARGRVGPEPP